MACSHQSETERKTDGDGSDLECVESYHVSSLSQLSKERRDLLASSL